MKKNRKNQTYTSQKQNYFVLRPNPIFYGNRKIEDEIMVIEDHPQKTTSHDWLSMDLEHAKHAWFIPDTQSERRIRYRRLNKMRFRRILDFKKLGLPK